VKETRAALIIANYHYEDSGLRRLVAPAQDAENLARVLSDPERGSFEVQKIINESSHRVNQKIEAFFDNRQHTDLLLIYFSGHGIKDIENRLYFATPDTKRRWPRTTSIPAALINDVMRSSRSRRQILILDCCYSGAFAKGMMAKAEEYIGNPVRANEQLAGRGRVVMTASDAIQYAFEGDDVEGTGVQSVFTKHLVKALESGEADVDGDGKITFDELYEYVYGRVTEEMPHQNPEKWDFGVQGSIIIAHNPKPVVKPAKLPPELKQSIKDTRPWVREGAARQLGRLLKGVDRSMALAAKHALLQMTKDDSITVRAIVNQNLKLLQGDGLVAEKAEEAQAEKEDKESVAAYRNLTLKEEEHGDLPSSEKVESKVIGPRNEVVLEDLDFTMGDSLVKFINEKRLKPLQVAFLATFFALLSSLLIALMAGTLIGRNISSHKPLVRDSLYFLSDLILIPVVWAYYVWIVRAPRETLSRLAVSRILAPERTQLEKARQILNNRWVFILTSLIAIAAALIYFLQYADFIPSLWFNSTLGFLALRTFVVVLPTAFAVVSILARIVVNSLIFRHLIQGVQVNPLHPDNAGGLLPISQYALKTSYLFALVMMVLAFQWINVRMGDGLGSEWLIFLWIVVLLLVAPFSLMAPLITAHREMLKVKNDLLLEFSKQIDKDNIEQYEQLPKMKQLADSILVWPIDFATLRRFFFSMIFPVIIVVISILLDFILD
jgi:hypothetical protein